MRRVLRRVCGACEVGSGASETKAKTKTFAFHPNSLSIVVFVRGGAVLSL